MSRWRQITVPLPGLAARPLKFYSVGAAGALVQLAALALFRTILKRHYLAATARAVETAVLHNFLWHERWTWNDRTAGDSSPWRNAARLARFNLTTGLISILANLVLMRFFVGSLRTPYLPAKVLAIVTASLGNFLASEKLVFRVPRL
ncbi:MAG: GtrA family protein [Bryobacteraceae bacterium]